MTTIPAATAFVWPTDATAGSTWTATATNWSGTYTDNQFIDQIKFHITGYAADKQSEEPYKSMNTWYTTNKAAIDAASLASSTQVAAYAIWMDMQLAIRSASMLGDPCYSDLFSTAGDANITCTTNSSGVLKFATGDEASSCSEVGQFGDSFAVGLVNGTTNAKTPLLRWGARTTKKATSATAGDEGAFSTGWYQYDWTPTTTITDFTSFTTDQKTTLNGVSAAISTPASDITSGNGIDITTATATELTCDDTKWATTTACEGVTMWKLDTIQELVVLSGSTLVGATKGRRRAQLWLADENPATPASVFGVEKEQAINVILHQKTTWASCVDAGADIAFDTTADDERKSEWRYAWGVHTWTHNGASSTLLGASAVMAALVSFF